MKASLKKIEKNLELGIETADRTRIAEMARQIESLLDKGDLTLADAKTLKQNINAAIYDKSLSPVVKKYYTEMRNSVNEYINRIGEKIPEHGKPYSSAEQKTVELKKLKSEQKDFDTHQKEALKEINKNYNEDLRNLKREYSDNEELRNLKREYSESKSTFKQQEQFVNNIAPLVNKFSGAAIGALAYYISSFLGFGPVGQKIAGFITTLTHEGIKEQRIYRSMLQDHPDLIRDFNNLIKYGVSNNKYQIANTINRINADINEYKENNKPKKYRLLS